MRRLACGMFFFLLLGGAPAAWAGPAEEAAQILHQWVQAYHQGNAEAVGGLYAPDAVFISALSPFRVEGRDAIRAAYAGGFRTFPTRVLVHRQVSTRAYGGTAVTDTYWSLTVVDAKGNARTYHGRGTIVSEEVQGQRVIVSHHHSLLPASP
jgi:uncharacterized protein (TIGR02246 family)